VTTSGPQVRRASDTDTTGELGPGPLSHRERGLRRHAGRRRAHTGTGEDDYSIVLEGRLGVLEDGVEVYATAGDVVFKRRGRWHTFWNAGTEPLRLLELISPGGIEASFRKLAEPSGEYDPASLPALAAEYGGLVDFDATMPVLERHGLRFADRAAD
jgi:hypothetical protein